MQFRSLHSNNFLITNYSLEYYQDVNIVIRDVHSHMKESSNVRLDMLVSIAETRRWNVSVYPCNAKINCKIRNFSENVVT